MNPAIKQCLAVCRLPGHQVASSACCLRGAGRSWLRRPCSAAAATQQETQQAQPLSKRQQKKKQQQKQQQQGGGGKDAAAVTPRSTDYSRFVGVGSDNLRTYMHVSGLQGCSILHARDTAAVALQ